MKKQILILSLIFLGTQTQGYSAVSIGKTLELKGKVEELKYFRNAQSGPLKPDQPLYYNDEIVTGSHSTTRLGVDDFTANIKAGFYVYEDSKFTLDKEIIEATGKKIRVRHTQGKLNSLVKGLQKSDEIQIETPHGTVGVRGTCVQTDLTTPGTVKIAADSPVTFNGVSLSPSGTTEFTAGGGKKVRVESILDKEQCDRNRKALDVFPEGGSLPLPSASANCP